MPEAEVLAAFPTRVRASSARADLWYERVPGLYAVHGRIPDALRTSAVLVLNDGAIAVLRGSPDRNAAGPGLAAMTPVYALQPNDPPAVPSGLVFVRFAEPVTVEARSDHLNRAGYTIAELLPYAPHAAWVRASEGGIAASLAGLPRLVVLPDVVSVEPQMLHESVRR